MSRLIFIILLTMAVEVRGEWLCKDASSVSYGNSILACGVGSDVDLQKARDISRESAVKEFNRLCSLSKCKEYESIVIPKRTDCHNKNGTYQCYRALEFQILSTLKKDIVVDVAHVNSLIKNKEAELRELETALVSLESLNRLDKKVAIAKEKKEQLESKLDQLSSESIELEQKINHEVIENQAYKYTHLLYKHNLRVGINYHGYKFSNSDEVNLGVNLSYEWRPFYYIGLVLGYTWGGDFNGDLLRSDGDVPPDGPSNSTQTFKGEMKFSETSVGLIMYPQFHGLYFKGQIGFLEAEREQYSVDYGPLGTRLSTSSTKITYNEKSYSILIGLDRREDYKGFGWFVELGAGSLGGDSVVPVGQVGLNFGF